GVRRVLRSGAGEVDQDLHRPGLAGIAAQVPAELQLVELVGHTGERLEPDGVADLAHARRVAVPGDRTLDDLEDRHLLLAEALPAACLRLLARRHRGALVAHVPCSCPDASSNVGGPWWGDLIETVSDRSPFDAQRFACRVRIRVRIESHLTPYRLEDSFGTQIRPCSSRPRGGGESPPDHLRNARITMTTISTTPAS